MPKRSLVIQKKLRVLIMLAAVCLQFVFLSSLATAATIVSGKISGSVCWVPESSPYIVSGDIIVARGATLTIAAGTEVRFRRFSSSQPYSNRGVLRVLGTLKVEGTKESRVYFGLFEDGALGDWAGIWVDGYYGGRVIMEYAEVEKAQRGIYVSGGSPVIKYSRFSSNLTGIYLEQTTDFCLEGNVLSGNDYGLYLDSSQGTAQKNSVVSNSWGIYSFLSKGVSTTHNAIKSNTFGIALDGGLQDIIEYNDFSIRKPNDYGVYLIRGKPARINHNNFFYDPEIVADPSRVFWYIWNNDNVGEVNASHNWWDTVRPEIIEAYIMDRRDRSYLGLVNYLPFASGPISGTADDISAPVISISTVSPFSPVAYAKGEVSALYVTYTLSETAKQLTARLRDSNGLMGPENAVLWSRTWREESELLRDGQHAWTWDGRLANGEVLVDGIYQLEMIAEDREVAGLLSEVTRARLIIDSIPPILKILFPTDGYTLHSNRLTMKGTLQDDNLVGGFVVIRERSLGESVRAGLTGNTWEAFIPRLREGHNRLEVTGFDGARNSTQQAISVSFEPVLDLRITTPTNKDSQVIRGTIREQFVTQVSRVEVKVGDQSYATKIESDGFETSVAVPLTLGENDVLAIAYDVSGLPFGEVAAVIEYDPLYDITVTKSFPAGLQMVSVPMTPFDDEPTAIFDSSLARWQFSKDTGPGYAYDGEGLDRVTPYRGYWWKPAVPRTRPANGKAYDPAKGFQFPLDVGWNQIGCPFLQPVQWEKAQFAVDQGRALSWQEAVREGWLSRGLWTYRDGGYVPSTTLQPWSGYWVLAHRQLQVTIPPVATEQGDESALIAAKGMAASAQAGGLVAGSSGIGNPLPSGPSSWNLQLSISAGGMQDRYNYLGVAPGAKRGFDPEYDLEKPPPVQGPTIWLDPGPSQTPTKGKALSPTVLGDSWNKGTSENTNSNATLPTARPEGLRLAADYRRLDEQLVWDVFIDTGSQTEDITLAWIGNWDPTCWQLTLLDVSTNSQLPLPSCGTRTLSLAPGETKHLKVQATSLGGSLSLQDVWPYPNPWNMVQPLKLGFTLNQSALVEARIYDLAGNLVRILPTEKKTAGRHYLLWDGRNGRGRIAANGLYFFQLTARPANGGKTVTAQGRLAILR
ncbi:MAG: hypothetical protein GX977_07190 [Firmicutes bacterium]|nr:hypothetical protein [Bacillota bacterium]